MKNKILILLLILFTSLSSIAQSKDSVLTGYINSGMKFKEIFYKLRADSIDNVIVNNKIPAFLDDDCFDSHHPNMWTGLHQPISVRCEILKRVHNIQALKYIICLDENSMKANCSLLNENTQKYNSDLSLTKAIPYVDKSFYDLIVWRYYTLLMNGKLIK